MSKENDFNFFDESEESIYELPSFYYEWDGALKEKKSPRFLEAEEVNKVLEIYTEDFNVKKLKASIKYALSFHPDNEELILDIMMYLTDLKQWNDLYEFSEKYKNIQEEVWPKSHRLIALLHLGMEEDAFTYFQKLKKEYENDKEKLSIIYQAIGETLNDINLSEAALKVASEANAILGTTLEIYWVELRAYTSLKQTEKALDVAGEIEKLTPMDKENWMDLGVIYSDLEDYEKAIDAFEFAKSLGLQNFDVYMSLIEIYEKNNNTPKAFETAKEFLSLNPDYIHIYPLAAALALESQLWEETFEMIDKALAVVPTEEIFLCKSEAFLRMGEHKKAIQALQEGIEIMKDDKLFLEKHLEELKKQFPDLME